MTRSWRFCSQWRCVMRFKSFKTRLLPLIFHFCLETSKVILATQTKWHPLLTSNSTLALKFPQSVSVSAHALVIGPAADICTGTWQAKAGEVQKAVAYALKDGYRHIDAAL